MRRESSTVIALVGEVREVLLTELARFPNVSVARPAGPDGDSLDAAIQALRQASRRMSPFVLVPADPLGGVASAWQAMWDLARPPADAAGFEERARGVLAASRAGRFELPDYYLVLTGAEARQGDLYLGPLRAARPHRVMAVVTTGGAPGVPAASGPSTAGPGGPAGPAHPSDGGVAEEAARVLHALRSLRHGPWWPPLDELIDTVRHFYPGGLTEREASRAALVRGRPSPG